jgi:hypothetical protein
MSIQMMWTVHLSWREFPDVAKQPAHGILKTSRSPSGDSTVLKRIPYQII